MKKYLLTSMACMQMLKSKEIKRSVSRRMEKKFPFLKIGVSHTMTNCINSICNLPSDLNYTKKDTPF